MAQAQRPPEAAIGRVPGQVAGIDEAGRGSLAGPVVAAAVILPESYDLPGLNDSKLVSPGLRLILAEQIKACCVAWSLGIVWQRRIEKINILQATLEAMANAVSSLAPAPGLLLIDGNRTIPEPILINSWQKAHADGLPRQLAIVGGDRLEPAISAASILAKTCRDRLMANLGRRWPEYGFEQHKGYGTARHLRVLRAIGPCPLHRLTFRGTVSNAVWQRLPSC